MRFLLPAYLVIASVAVADEPSKRAMSQPTSEQLEFFEKSIRPILVERCHKCHGPKKQEAELRLDTRAGILKGGESGPIIDLQDAAKSELIAAINYGADSFQMPPDGKLKQEEIAALTKWVKMGVPWPKSKSGVPAEATGKEFNLSERAKHWSFQPVKQPTIPDVKDENWPRNPIDRFVLSRLEEADLVPSAAADKRTLLRRLSYDLTGLPPTVEELEHFLADNSPTAYEQVVDRLLASPRYGERWGRHWLDLVRYAETGGHEFDYAIPHAWPYRDYVIRAFNQDVPYNLFVVEHIDGDQLLKPRRRALNGDNESVIGTAFYWFSQGKHSPVDIRAEECDTIDNQIDVLGKTFLGLTIACARCHDHKFDPIRARDYYALAGYLQSSRRQVAILDDPSGTQKLIEMFSERTPDERNAIVEYEVETTLAQLESLSDLMRRPAKSDEARRKAWEKLLTEVAARKPSELFHAWAVLRKYETPEKFMAARVALSKHLQNLINAAASQTTKEIPLYSDRFDGKQWHHVDGPAFGEGLSQMGHLIVRDQPTADGSVVKEVVQSGLAHSGVISRRLEGTLQSPTFTIEKRYVYYRARRIGGKPNPGRAVKNGQLHLIVDGFQYIKSPLYGGLTINVPNDGRWRWHRHDVSKFIGRKAYVEIVDEDDGAIVVERVIVSDAGPPADPPNRLIVKMLDDPEIVSPEQLADSYRKLLVDTLAVWKQGRLTNDVNAVDRIGVINDLLSHRQILSTTKLLKEIPTAVKTALASSRTFTAAVTPPRRSVAMTDGSEENAHLLIRGNHKKPGEIVERRFLEVLSRNDQPARSAGSGRWQLAWDIADSQNPLTARVMVNRIWQHHFGLGLVASPDNFGRQGSPPSHPQLLDWLASEFVRNGWSIKQMHRLMLLSSTYRMSGRSSNARAEKLDPANILLHRMNIKRLEGEAIRDGLLAISGRLDDRKYGPGVLPHLSPFMEGRGRPRTGPLDGDGRRSIYMSVRRNFLPSLFLAFDLPSPSSTIGRRSVSNVPAQALTMMNNPFVIQQAALWANRTIAETQASGGRQPADDAEDRTTQRITRLYETAFSRPPTDDELAAAKQFLTEQGKEYNGADDPRTWADLCHVLLNVKEFVFVK